MAVGEFVSCRVNLIESPSDFTIMVEATVLLQAKIQQYLESLVTKVHPKSYKQAERKEFLACKDGIIKSARRVFCIGRTEANKVSARCSDFKNVDFYTLDELHPMPPQFSTRTIPSTGYCCCLEGAKENWSADEVNYFKSLTEKNKNCMKAEFLSYNADEDTWTIRLYAEQHAIDVSMLQDPPLASLPSGDAYVMHAESPELFFVMFMQDMHNLQSIASSLNSLDRVQQRQGYPGEIVLVDSESRAQLCRARVVAGPLANAGYDVLLIDYGNREVARWFYVCPPQLAVLRPICHPCAYFWDPERGPNRLAELGDQFKDAATAVQRKQQRRWYVKVHPNVHASDSIGPARYYVQLMESATSVNEILSVNKRLGRTESQEAEIPYFAQRQVFEDQTCVISHVTRTLEGNAQVHVQLVSDADIAKQVDDLLIKFYSDGKNPKLLRPKLDSPCIYFHPQYKEWYRALIKQIENDAFMLLLIDHGEECITTKMELYTIHEKFLQFYPLAIRCHLQTSRSTIGDVEFEDLRRIASDATQVQVRFLSDTEPIPIIISIDGADFFNCSSRTCLPGYPSTSRDWTGSVLCGTVAFAQNEKLLWNSDSRRSHREIAVIPSISEDDLKQVGAVVKTLKRASLCRLPRGCLLEGGACLLELFGQWYRGQIEEEDVHGVVKVRLVDYGSLESVHLVTLREVPNGPLMEICPLALRLVVDWVPEVREGCIATFSLHGKSDSMWHARFISASLPGRQKERIGDVIEGSVEWTEQEVEWWQRTDDKQTNDFVNAELAKIENKTNPSSPVPMCHPGLSCLAPFERSLYRSRILSVDSGNETAKVFFVDFGNSVEVAVGELLLVPESLQGIPPLAIPCIPPTASPEDPTPRKMLISGGDWKSWLLQETEE